MPNPNPRSFVFEPSTPNEVYLLIDGLNKYKGTGPNGIPTEILQLINFIICIPLSKIYNICIVTGKQPDKLKLAHALPFSKKVLDYSSRTTGLFRYYQISTKFLKKLCTKEYMPS